MNDIDYTDFVHTGPATLAGRYLRMFWQPVYRAQDLAPGQAVPVRIMSEEFTLYRGKSGTPHVVAFRCAHRQSQLSTGWVEGDTIRCFYHGWRYDSSGQCVEQPGEDEAFASKVRIRSYPAKEYFGLIFAYIGEGEPPLFPRHLQFEGEDPPEATPPEVWPCNYFNRLDNFCDLAHVAFTHRGSTLRANRPDHLAIRELSAEETEYGVKITSTVPGKPPGYKYFYMPNATQVRSVIRNEGSLEDAGNLKVDRLSWSVPIDDEHCARFIVEKAMSPDMRPLTGDAAKEYRERRLKTRSSMAFSSNNEAGEAILAGKTRIEDIDPNTSTYYSFWLEDYVAQVGQGAIPDRSKDRLGRMDVGVTLLRKIWRQELKALAERHSLKQWTSPQKLEDMATDT